MVKLKLQPLATIILVLLLTFPIKSVGKEGADFDLVLVTVATDETDGLLRLHKSANAFGHHLHVFGLGETWSGGDMRSRGGAQKIRILRENIIPYRNKANVLLLFVDAYDVIITSDSESILRDFFINFPDKRIVFGAESFCWPDRTLAPKYPPVVFGERFLNSGMFIGYAGEIAEMLDIAKKENLKDDDDDQLFYTKIYLNKELRDKLKIGLDSLSLIFQNLNGATEFLNIDYDENKLYNSMYNTHPSIVHGNGPSKFQLNTFANYLVLDTKPANQIKLKLKSIAEYSKLGLAIFIRRPIPYVEEFFHSLSLQDYAKEKMHIFISSCQNYNRDVVDKFQQTFGHMFASMEVFNLDNRVERDSRIASFDWALASGVEYMLMLDADAHLTNPNALNLLVARASTDNHFHAILAPLLLRPGTIFSNFWGAISDNGFYARSTDYVDIVQGSRPGIWNVPFVGSAILVARRKFQPLRSAYQWNTAMDSDISFAEFCRTHGHFMFVDALDGPDSYGFLVNTDGFAQLPPEAHLNLEVYDFSNNKMIWERRYIHPEYFALVKPESTVPLACPDVYDFPFLSERFCKEIIEIMEDFGRWSDGTHKDKRIQGGYENVPTRDIHMNQVGLENHWLKILDDYIAPMQEKVFIGFYQRPIHSNMMFVVRYRPDEQPALRPHHDASTYSIDVALNRRGEDYEGGGVRFLRYNCTISADKVGWTMLFPGRLTHLHEGLPTTNGTRYILVSFINP